MCKKIEKTGFIILNIVLYTNVIFWAGGLSFLTLYMMDANKHPYLPFLAIFVGLSLILINHIVKYVSLPLIYKSSNTSKEVKDFLLKIEENTKFRNIILLLTAIADCFYIFYFALKNGGFHSCDIPSGICAYLIFGGGVFPSYLSLLIWLKLTNQSSRPL